ncbi:MAG: hypothetical protein ABW278_03935, partial [Steroidobacteraceae bacterium]
MIAFIIQVVSDPASSLTSRNVAARFWRVVEGKDSLEEAMECKRLRGRPRRTSAQIAKAHHSTSQLVLKKLEGKSWPLKRGELGAAIAAAAEDLQIDSRTVETSWASVATNKARLFFALASAEQIEA